MCLGGLAPLRINGQAAVCQGCRGKGTIGFVGWIRIWNLTNPSGSWPQRARCLVRGHDWQSIDVLEVCQVCFAVWDQEWHETPAPR